MGFWQRQFLFRDTVIALGFALILLAALWVVIPAWVSTTVAKGELDTFTATVATIYGALFGFALAAASILISVANRAELDQVRRSVHYPKLWVTLSQTTASLGFACLVALLLLLAEVSDFLATELFGLFVLASAYAIARLTRTVWILHKVMMTIA